MMKKITLFLFFLTATFGFSQNTVTVEVGTSPGNYNGYNNVFNTPADGSGYIYGEVFGVPDLVTEIGANNVTLKPNVIYYINTPGDPFWRNNGGAGPDGNKIVEANTYIEPGVTFNNVALTFTGEVTSNNLDNSRYSVVAFIKTVGTGGGFLKTVDLTAPFTGIFSVSATATDLASGTIQYGFAVTGLNSNPVDDWGSVIVAPVSLSTNDLELSRLKLFPNPTKDSWTIKTNNDKITSIQVYDILGKSVLSLTPNSTEAKIDASTIKSGLYFAKIATDNGSSSIKLIKN